MGVNLSSIDQGDYEQGPAALQVNANWTLGPLLWGWSANLFLCGVVVSWAGTYWSRRKGDRTAVKLAVAVAVVFECLTAVMNLASIIQHGKSQDRTNYAISLLTPLDALGVSLGAVTAVAVQSFFAARCYRLLPRNWRFPFVVWISVLTVAGFAGALGITIVEFINKGATDVTRGASPQAYAQLYYLAEIWLWSNCGADATISFLLIFRLWQNRKAITQGGASEQANSMINSFMKLALETAFTTMICSVAGAVCYVTMTETTNMSYAFSDMLPALYALSLLWALNSTHRLRDEVNPRDGDDPAHAIQLVWNLAPGSAVDRGQQIEQLARGEEVDVSVKMGTAPSKAAQKLGCQVRVLTIGGRGGASAGDESSKPRSYAEEKDEMDD